MNNPWTPKKVSEIESPDHTFIDSNDRCLFFLEYAVGKRYNFCTGNDFDGNNFISNLKKPVSREGTSEYRYKLQAIRTAGENLAAAIKEGADKMVCVPIPPSKHQSDPEYDDRMLRVLLEFERQSRSRGHDPLVLELVEQKENIRASHASPGNRPRPEELARNYNIRHGERGTLIESGRKYIYVVDDMLTAGAHFKAMQKVILAEKIPGIKVMGIFLARRIPSTAEESEPHSGGGEP